MAAEGEQRASSPRLGEAEMTRLVQRLYYQQMELAARREEERRRQLSKSCIPPRRINKDAEGDLVRRIYDQQLERFRQGREERERKAYEEMHRCDKKVLESDIQEQVERIYAQEIAKSKARREELQKRYLPEMEPKKISKTKLKQSVERLSHVDYAKRDEELFKKHVYPYDPQTVKISHEEVEAMANRLSTRGSA
ncbi:hypothetical protein TraAM80_05335 [Trypanosoma rangeli]|uniref:Uncharacterized protein n=1 Tax=Trypanosoma rangeli TaxID=5698 RepID=A0A422NF15_TRYRA|nr:uncharacterized protein TraAM80_05335 [Trypanosoma rangeli]RNF04058.1 hypothetical protein TraAM80_05335 [Trypanosoma rangeli]|eukprot:RNF04058.1 hypothetical protein TraAM80_05335 [Trypanosoma rangeli]